MVKKYGGVIIVLVFVVLYCSWAISFLKATRAANEAFKKSLIGMSPEAIHEARVVRLLKNYSPDERTLIRMILEIRNGDVVILGDGGMGVAVVYLDGAIVVWNGPMDLASTRGNHNHNDALLFARSIQKVIHVDDPEWAEYARLVYGGPKPKSAE